VRTAADEGAAVEGRLEADVAEVVVVVEVVIHRPVHLGEILLHLRHGDTGSTPRLGLGDSARVESLHDLEEPSASVSICNAHPHTDQGKEQNPEERATKLN
jgi:hypothetical protein